MDLGLKGRKALVCAASKGLGRACAESLAEAGVEVTICSRTKADIEETANVITNKFQVNVKSVACDITTEEGRMSALQASGDIDILVNNAGGPPPGNFRDWNREDWIKAVDANMLTGIELIKLTIDPMINKKFGTRIRLLSLIFCL